jgi:hypothetical protein
MNKLKLSCIAIVVAASALSFYAGTKYAGSSSSASLTPADTSAGAQGANRQGGARQRGAGAGSAGFVSGVVLSKTDQSIVIQSRDGSSKIVFISPSTEVSKFVLGTATDIELTKNATVSGDINPDGSINAKTIQIRPEGQPGMNRQGQPSTTPPTN